MSDLIIERTFAASPEKVFAFVTRMENLVQWWGPEGITLPEHNLNLTEPGDWYSVMQNSEGQRFKVSGVVKQIDPPRSVEFTWAWHDDEDVRGHESVVRFEIVSDGGGGTLFKLVQTGLEDEELAKRHEGGWTSSFAKLERLLN